MADLGFERTREAASDKYEPWERGHLRADVRHAGWRRAAEPNLHLRFDGAFVFALGWRRSSYWIGDLRTGRAIIEPVRGKLGDRDTNLQFPTPIDPTDD